MAETFMGDVAVEWGVSTAMRDGVRLTADIYRPRGDGPFPVLLMRQPYGRKIASTVVYAQPAYFARQGYIVVIQDVRGRGDSEGEFYPFRDERLDGYDTVMWAANLPDSNGAVGMYGFSYQGYTQIAAAAERPPPLRAIAPHMTAWDLYSGWFYTNGNLHLHGTLTWGLQMLRENAARSTDPSAKEAYRALEQAWGDAAFMCRQLPIEQAHPVTMEGTAPFVRDWLTNTEDSAYWRDLDLLKLGTSLEIPVFHLSGWYDYFLRGSLDGYKAAFATSPEKQFLIAAPWVHIPWGDKTALGTLGHAAHLDIDALLVQFFDQHLKGEDHAITGTRYYVLGAEEWRSAAQWPPAAAREQVWHLASDGNANSSFGDGRLTPDAPSGPADAFVYDPETPVLAPGGSFGGGLAWGPAELSAAQQGNNLLVYTSEPFREETTLAGPTKVALWVSSSAEETMFVARLSRVAVDGTATFLTLGCSAPFAVEAEQRQEITFSLNDTACALQVGESLRLDIASSAFPLFARHPNTAAGANRVTSGAEYTKAVQIVHHEPTAPSRLHLPFLHE